MRLKLKMLGVLYNCLIRSRDIANTYKLYKITKRDMAKIKLSEEEEGWMADNGIDGKAIEWEEIVKMKLTDQLIADIKQLKKMTSSKIREELRRIHEGWMMRIQKEADKGKIGLVLKRIIGDRKDFSLETLKSKGRNITDAKEIANELKEHFGNGFSTSEVERE
jgi:DNA-binding protein